MWTYTKPPNHDNINGQEPGNRIAPLDPDSWEFQSPQSEEIFEKSIPEIQVFPSPTGDMLTFIGFPVFYDIFYRFF
jgi:hypothetical protein